MVDKKKKKAGGTLTKEIRQKEGLRGDVKVKGKDGTERVQTPQEREKLEFRQGAPTAAEKIAEKKKETEGNIDQAERVQGLAEEAGVIKEEGAQEEEVEAGTRITDFGRIAELGIEIPTINDELQARMEGRKPYGELPTYQQYLAEIAVLGVSPKAITKVGKLGQVGKTGLADDAVGVAGKFASNSKSAVLTKRFAAGLGISLFAADKIIDTLGTYPFAGFIKEEALQTNSFAFTTANKNNDIEGMEAAVKEQEEFLNAIPTIADKIPYLNVVRRLNDFYEAAKTKLEIDKKVLEKKRGE